MNKTHILLVYYLLLILLLISACYVQTSVSLHKPTEKTLLVATPVTNSSPNPLSQWNAVAFVVGDWQNQGNDTLWIANLDGSGEKKILDNIDQTPSLMDTSGQRIAWSPNGEWLAVIRQGTLWLISPTGGKARLILTIDKNSEGINQFHWSPNSQQIVLQELTNDLHDSRLRLVDLNEQVTDLVEGYLWPGWSPDGKWLALLAKDPKKALPDNYQTMKVMNTSTLALHDLDNRMFCGWYGSPTWSPQSDRLSFLDKGNGRFAHGKICLLTLDGQIIHVTQENQDASRAFWSADGHKFYIGMANFEPLNPNLPKDYRLMVFDHNGYPIEQIHVADELGSGLLQLDMSLNHQWLSYLNTEKGELYLLDPECRRIFKQKNIRLPAKPIAPYHWAADNRTLVLMLGDYSTPNGLGVRYYGSLYALDTQTGQLSRLTNEHWIKAFIASPSRTKIDENLNVLCHI